MFGSWQVLLADLVLATTVVLLTGSGCYVPASWRAMRFSYRCEP